MQTDTDTPSAGPTSPERETHVSHNAEHQHICADHGVETWRCGHTPGPWCVDAIKCGGWDRWIISASPNSVAECHEETGSTLANARLIAAAPELLAIAQEIANSKCDLGDSERRIRLYSAITKAGGAL